MMREEYWYDEAVDEEEEEEASEQDNTYVDSDFFSLLSKPKNYYKTLEVDFNATEDNIRSNYIRLALQWHPDKRKDEDSATSRFQEINEAYKDEYVFRSLVTRLTPANTAGPDMAVSFLWTVLSDPRKRREYDRTSMLYADDYNIIDYLNQYKGLILTCNGLGIRHSIW